MIIIGLEKKMQMERISFKVSLLREISKYFTLRTDPPFHLNHKLVIGTPQILKNHSFKISRFQLKNGDWKPFIWDSRHRDSSVLYTPTVQLFSSLLHTHTLLVQTHKHDVSAPWWRLFWNYFYTLQSFALILELCSTIAHIFLKYTLLYQKEFF